MNITEEAVEAAAVVTYELEHPGRAWASEALERQAAWINLTRDGLESGYRHIASQLLHDHADFLARTARDSNVEGSIGLYEAVGITHGRADELGST